MVLEEIGISMSRHLRDCCARNTDSALRLPGRIKVGSAGCADHTPERGVLTITARWRSASSCCRGWGAGCREVRLPFSCYRGTPQVLGEWRCAPSRQEFARRYLVTRYAPPVAALGVAVSLPGALLRQ